MGGKLKSLSAASVHCVYKIWLNVKLIGSLTVFSPFPQLMDKESFLSQQLFFPLTQLIGFNGNLLSRQF